MEFTYELKIPKDRIAVLIGKSGEIKKEVEEVSKTKIDVDSTEGDVTITGDDALGLFTAREVVKAISRGFNPEFAKLLFKGDYSFESINIKEFGCVEKKQFLRLKGRVIGKDGKSRHIIEELTDTYISVYGKTISIIGLPESVANARKAIESLLTGSPHANVYQFLERKRRERHQSEILDLYQKSDEVKIELDKIRDDKSNE